MSAPSLNNKVALITGGSKGIGRAAALRLAKDGATVVINYSSDAAAAESLVQEIGSQRALDLKADASKISEIEKMVDEVVKRFGKIDILFANAGQLPMATLEATTEEAFDYAMAINVKGPYFLVQKAVKHMPPGSHVLLNSTTLCVSPASPPYMLYLTTKGAVEQMVRVLCKDLATKDIAVNAIAPGPTATELFLKGKPEAMLKTIAGMNPHNRLGQVEEIADAVAFLCGSDSRWVSGQVLRVNGGVA